MSFAWPLALVLLLLVPLLVWGYVRLIHRRDVRAAELATQGFAPNEAARRARRRRHVPFALFLVALTLLLLGFARPRATLDIPHREGTVVLAFDVSSSMRAADLKPTRLAAAKAAARAFVDRQPSSIRLGVVAFSAGSLVVQPPTGDRTAVKAAIDHLTAQGATSLSRGIFASLRVIAGKSLVVPRQSAGVDGSGELDLDNAKIGFYGSAAVVLLSDGENTSQADPQAMAKLASAAGVKIYTLGIGSPEGTVVQIDGFNVATALDEKTLQNIAAVTDGRYYRASDAAALSDVYRHIDLKWETRGERTEMTGAVAGAGAALLVAGAALTLLWFGRVV
jgi:Ca-activated chloride channel family protein